MERDEEMKGHDSSSMREVMSRAHTFGTRGGAKENFGGKVSSVPFATDYPEKSKM
jgi:hypothetical protein